MSIKERLKHFIKHSKMSVLAFEKSISASNGYVNSVTKSIGSDKLDSIEQVYPWLNLSWLIRGEGEMLKNGSVQEEKVEDAQTLLVGKRLAEYAEMQGISIKEFGIKSGIGYNNSASILKGTLPVGMAALQKIKKGFPNLDTEWVLFGNGGMELNNEQKNRELVDAKQETIESLKRENELLRKMNNPKEIEEIVLSIKEKMSNHETILERMDEYMEYERLKENLAEAKKLTTEGQKIILKNSSKDY